MLGLTSLVWKRLSHISLELYIQSTNFEGFWFKSGAVDMINYTAGPRSLNAMIHIYDAFIYGFKTVFNQNRAGGGD